MKVTRLLPLTLLLLLVCMVPTAMAALSVGNPAPDFTLKDVNNMDHSLSDFEGKVVMILFWQST